MKIREAFSILLALSIVIGGIYIMDRFIKPKEALPNATTPPEKERVFVETHGTANSEPKMIETKREAKIKKCVIQGKTVYSDTECELAINAASVQINDTAGFVTKTAQAGPRKVEIQQHQQQPQIATIGPRPQTNCEQVKARIEALDSWARQPLPGEQQDSIREERRKLTALNC